jgi:predicted O-linked N-acetylglucosamine transferase (SPINDLY family)
MTTADVVLDPLHFGGGNTSYQALGLGLPIVTLPGAFMRGRVTAGCYRKMGVGTCIATTSDEYIDLAVRLGTDAAFNAAVRAEIVAHSGALFEDENAVHEFEAFLHSAVAQALPTIPRPRHPAAA